MLTMAPYDESRIECLSQLNPIDADLDQIPPAPELLGPILIGYHGVYDDVPLLLILAILLKVREDRVIIGHGRGHVVVLGEVHQGLLLCQERLPEILLRHKG